LNKKNKTKPTSTFPPTVFFVLLACIANSKAGVESSEIRQSEKGSADKIFENTIVEDCLSFFCKTDSWPFNTLCT